VPDDFRREDGGRVTNAISRRLAEEARIAPLDPLNFPELPSIPTIRGGPMVGDFGKAMTAIKQILDVREGRSGSILDKALTLRDLMDEGAMSLNLGNQHITGSQTGSVAVGSGYIDPRPVLLIPPVLTNFTATAALRNVIIDWDMLDYANHAYVEIWRHTADNLAAATLLGTTTANLFSDNSGSVGTTYYYWGRAIAIGGALGPFNAVGGTAATVGGITGTDIADLSITAAKLSQGTYPNINLVPNPSAEDGVEAWTLFETNSSGTVTLTASTAQKASGSQSFLIGKSATSAGRGYASRVFPLISGETYSFRVRVLGSSATGSGLYLGVALGSSKPASNHLTTASGSGDLYDELFQAQVNAPVPSTWTTYETTFTVPVSPARYWGSLYVYNWANGPTSMWFDDCSIGRQITASFIAANAIAVGTAAIQNGAIVNAMIGSAAIDSAKIADAAIVTAKIADLNVTGAKIADATITAAKIVDATITTAKIGSAQITTALIQDAAITDAKIANLSADKINAGSIRGINVNASSHGTKGSFFTSSVSAADGTVNLHSTGDFPSSGTALVYESGVNDYDTFTYSGKTSTTLTGCSGVLAHSSGATVVPAGSKSVTIDASTNELRMWDNIGTGTYARVAQVGSSNSDNAFAVFGHSSGTLHGVRAYTGTQTAVRAEASGSGGIGVEGISTGSGTAVSGNASGGGHGVFGNSSNTSGYGVLGTNNASSGFAVRGQATGTSGVGVYGSSSSGYGAEFVGNTTRAPLKLTASSAPSNVSLGAMYVDTSGNLYVANGSAWQLVGPPAGSPEPPPSTCFPAGALVLMANLTVRRIEFVVAGDKVWTPFGPRRVEKMDTPLLGSRRLLGFMEDSHTWSEEHAHWTRQDGAQWWWSANPAMWRGEVAQGAIGGLFDNDSMRGSDDVEFAHTTGWQRRSICLVRAKPDLQLYLPITDGAPIVVNGYLVGAGVNQAGCDYTALDWDAARASIS
jgi:hypothetical protein